LAGRLDAGLVGPGEPLLSDDRKCLTIDRVNSGAQ
jgi:hypothetical protein